MGIYSQLVDKTEDDQSSSRQQSRLENQEGSQPQKQQKKQSSARPSKEAKLDQILDRPKAFYITKRQSDTLDELVKTMRKKAYGKTTVKIDRSTILRLLLDRANLDDEKAADRNVHLNIRHS